MGIGAIYKELTFDGEQSGDYGLYITGAGTFNAPQRDVEMVTIPGRNGSFAHDRGRFENIEVTYPAGVYGSDESDFADKIADIRAWLCSKKGYVRLTDEYNPNEYRLAVYKSGLEVSPALLKAGEFDLVFECKPQRFLTSGETAQTIAASGDTLTNPTRFNARPMLEVNGYGKIGINGEEVEVISQALGWTNLLPITYNYGNAGTSVQWVITPDYTKVNTGDTIRIAPGSEIDIVVEGDSLSVESFSQTGDFVGEAMTSGGNKLRLVMNGDMINPFTFTLGTAKTASASIGIGYNFQGVLPYHDTITVQFDVNAAGVITISVTVPYGALSYYLTIGPIAGNSSQSALGNPLYFDLDIGEAYKIENGAYVSVNSAVYIPPELPELEPGANTITFDGTVSDLKIVPRWWTV